MKSSNTFVALLVASALPGLAHAGTVLDIDSKLDKKDVQLSSGEWYETYTFEATAGAVITVRMESSQFDTYVGLHSPSGEVEENDDFEGSSKVAQVQVTASETGTWTVYATTHAPGQKGKFSLSVDVTAPVEPGLHRISDVIDRSDPKLSSGEYQETWTFEGTAGQLVNLDLRSSEFDPYLILVSPSGKQSDNDDHEGSSQRSLVAQRLEESGTYKIIVTTYAAGMTGKYDLEIRVQDEDQVARGKGAHQGTLAAGDTTLSSGEYWDAYEIEGSAGDRVVVTLMSGAFDTYLMLRGPGELSLDNDDDGGSNRSRIETVLPESGTYRVAVTSYAAGASGPYSLEIDHQAAADNRSNDNDVDEIAVDVPLAGTLAAGDSTLNSGEFYDGYVFEAAAGSPIAVEMSSSEFDPYVGVILPDGKAIENDDFPGRGSTACVEFAAPANGRYRIMATTYKPGDAGKYSVRLTRSCNATTAPVLATGGRLHGVFMGISDYPDSSGASDLSYTREDAEALYAAVPHMAAMQGGRTYLYTDAQATEVNLRSSVATIAAEARAGDVFVFFYSGHGGRMKRDSWQQSDPDGIDETIVFADKQMTDDAFAQLMDTLPQGVTAMILMDSCFSGGFSKDVISAPGRMGMFSSEEDVTSAVAAKFRAGGYLARFLADALGEERLADDGSDGIVTALELSEYVQARYRTDVKSAPGEFVQVTNNLGYQHLVVDRGSIGPFDVLFRWH